MDLSYLKSGVINIADRDAIADGTFDNTKIFQKALDEMNAVGGGTVFVPSGKYAISTHLTIPDNVTLEGVFKAPATRIAECKGSVLLAFEGAGSEEGEAFITLKHNSTLKGLSVFYPEQDKQNLHPYPWCVRGNGDNCSIVDVLLVNPWNAVDFGTRAAGRHYIKGLYAQPLKTGVFVDKCFDVGRMENVHLWPFWDEALGEYTAKNSVGFIFGRTDWQFVTGCFCIFYKIGFLFKDFEHGAGNVLLVNSGSDVGPLAVKVEKVMPTAGISWSNCQFMAGIEISEENEGPVKFDNCGFWGVKTTTTHANVRGNGKISFNQCQFSKWDQVSQGHAAIYSEGRCVSITNCDFMDPDHNHIHIDKNAYCAIIKGNTFKDEVRIVNESDGDVVQNSNIKI